MDLEAGMTVVGGGNPVIQFCFAMETQFFFFLLIPWIVFKCYLRYIRCIREVSHGKETLPPPAKGKTSRPRSLWYGTNRTYISNRKGTRQNNQHNKQDTCPTTKPPEAEDNKKTFLNIS